MGRFASPPLYAGYRGFIVDRKWLPQWDTKWLVIFSAVATLVLFVVLPMLYLVYKSFIVGGTLDIHHYRTV